MRNGQLLALIAVALIGAGGLWLRTSRNREVPHDALFVIKGQPYGAADLEAILGRKPQFASLGEAEETIRAIADQIILEKEADRRYGADRSVSADNVLAKIVRETGAAAQPAESEIEAYYEIHRDQYVGPREVAFDMVSVEKTDAPDFAMRQISALRVRAEMNLELSRGSQVAIRRPDGAHWIEVMSIPCGDMDSSTTVEFPPLEVRRVACALPMGLVSRPIETANGWHLIRVTAQRAARNTSLERATAEIRTLLAEQASNTRWTDAIAKLREDANVVVSRAALLQLVEPEIETSTASGSVAPSGPPMPPGSGGRSS